jgi:hypothetical protein
MAASVTLVSIVVGVALDVTAWWAVQLFYHNTGRFLSYHWNAEGVTVIVI